MLKWFISNCLLVTFHKMNEWDRKTDKRGEREEVPPPTSLSLTSKPWHTPLTQTHPIPSLAVNHTSAGQEFRGQTLGFCCWRAWPHGGHCRSKLGLIKWDQTGRRRGFVWLSDLSSCVCGLYLSVHTCLCCWEKKIVLIFSNISKSFWHWSLPLENRVRAERNGEWGCGNKHLCTSGSTTVMG